MALRPYFAADDAGPALAGKEPAIDDVMALVVEAEPVDDGTVGGEPEHPRRRIALLGKRRDRADLDEAEAEGKDRVRHLAILVEAGGHADRIGKVEAEEVLPQARIAGGGGPKRHRRQRFQRQAVRGFRIEGEEERPEEAEGQSHAASSGRM